MKLFRKINDERGMALLIALMLVIMMSIIGIGIIKSSNDEISIAGNEMHEMKTFYAAQAGLDKAVAELQSDYEAEWTIPDILPAGSLNVDGITIVYSSTIDATVQKTLTKGPLAGLQGTVTPYHISSVAYDQSFNTQMTLEETFEVSLVPIFQFSVFYENDLEIAPGPSMILLGRIHSNADVYLQSNSGIDIDSYFTSHGDIHHGRKPGSGQSDSNGDVDIMGIDGSFHSMRDGSGWLDSDDSYWFDSAAARWGGRVQDAAFGQERLNLPIEDPTNPHSIIERDTTGGTGTSMENDATFKLKDGAALWYNGSAWIDVTATLLADGSLQETTFHDMREGQDVTVYDVDMSIFKSSAYFPSNGLMYTADNRSGLRGTRIYNADEVGAPFTISSENPVYTKGDINTVNKQPMAIITDALYILSDNWDDDPSKAASSNKYDRPAITTTTNFSYITGNRETADGVYNGGLENLPRFLEVWSGDTLNYKGSMINLWLSQEAVGDWSGGYYSPPFRSWEFDTDLLDPANMPPGTPMVRGFTRLGWKQAHVGYAFSGEATD